MSIRTFQGKRPVFPVSAYIDASAEVIGDVVLQEDVSIWPKTVVRGDVHSIRIGAGSNVQDGCILHASHAGKYAPQGHALSIGKGVTIGHQAVVHACSVGDYCLIGIAAVIMDGAVLEDYVMLGAGALVPPGRTLKSGYLYLGAPAKQARLLKEEEKEFLEYSSRHYVDLKNAYLVETDA